MKVRMFSCALIAATLVSVCGIVSAAGLSIQRVEDDKFSKEITILGAQLNLNPLFDGHRYAWVIRSWVNKKSGVARHQLVVSVNDGEYAGYNMATDEDAENLVVMRIGLIDASRESVGIDLTDAALRSATCAAPTKAALPP